MPLSIAIEFRPNHAQIGGWRLSLRLSRRSSSVPEGGRAGGSRSDKVGRRGQPATEIPYRCGGTRVLLR